MFTELFSKCAVISAIRLEGAGFIALAAIIICVVIVSTTWHYSRAREILERWANRNSYKLVASEYRGFAKGPFFWTSSKGQAVYYVTVQDERGKIRKGWVRCGGWWSGLMSDEATAKWE